MKHAAFQVRRQTPRKVDEHPHTLTQSEREQVLRALDRGQGAGVSLTRKLLGLYDQRTAACQELMRGLGLL